MHGRRIYDLKVDYFQQRIALYLCRNPGCELVGCRLMGFFDRSLQYLIYIRGRRPVIRIEQSVARRKRQPVLSAHDRAGDDLDRNAQLAYHFADYRDLLEVLLAEIGFGRFHQIEKPTHDLCHAVEVAGSGRTLHHFVDHAEVERAGVGFGIYLLDRRHENIVRTDLFEQAQVGFRGPGVIFQVGFVVELCRIDEYAHHDGLTLPACAFNQRTVSCVERTHGRDESDAGPVPAAECPAQFLAVCDCFHFLGLKS